MSGRHGRFLRSDNLAGTLSDGEGLGGQRIVAKIITSVSSPGPASQPSTIDNLGKVRGTANGITLSSGAVPAQDRGAILANSAQIGRAHV